MGCCFSSKSVFEEDCFICAETKPQTSFINTNGCEHVYCITCLQEYARAKLGSGSANIKCPHEDCEENFGTNQLKELLSPANLEILMIRQKEAAIPVSERVYCPFKDCSALMEKPGDDKESDQIMECWACHRGFCAKCNTPLHANMSCRENEEQTRDKELQNLAKENNWQTCNKCHQIVELKDGCIRVRCRCGYTFCYVCGDEWYTPGGKWGVFRHWNCIGSKG